MATAPKPAWGLKPAAPTTSWADHVDEAEDQGEQLGPCPPPVEVKEDPRCECHRGEGGLGWLGLREGKGEPPVCVTSSLKADALLSH